MNSFLFKHLMNIFKYNFRNIFFSPSNCFLFALFTEMPDIVSVSALDPASMVEGMEYSLMCDVMNVAPAKNLIVKWYKGNETVKTEQFNDTTEKPVNVSSLLTVTAERDDNGALYRCSAELHLGPNGPQLIPTVTSLPYSPDVHCEFDPFQQYLELFWILLAKLHSCKYTF